MKFKTLIYIVGLVLFLLPLKASSLYFHHLTVDNGLPHNTITSFVEDRYGFIWIATQEGVCRFDGAKINTYYADYTKNSTVNNRPLILHRRGDDIWISFSNSDLVCRYNYTTDDFTQFNIQDLAQSLQKALDRIEGNKNVYDSGKSTWQLRNNRLVQTNKTTDESYIFQGELTSKLGLSDSYIITIYGDSKGVLWVGTDNGGVHFADVNKTVFSHHTFNFDEGEYAMDNSLRTICTDDKGYVWIGTKSNGVIKLAPDKSSYSRFHFAVNDNVRKESQQIRKLYKDRHGDVWIGTRGGLYHYNSQTERIHSYSTHNPSAIIPHDWVYAINEDRHGILWIGTWAGLASYNVNTHTFTHHQLAGVESIRGIVTDKNKGLWIATESGLVFVNYNVRNNIVSEVKASHFTHNPQDKNTPKSKVIYAIDADVDNNIWMGTAKGLTMYNTDIKEFITFPQIDFLGHDIIRGIVCVDNYVWISHRRGITRLDRRTLSFRHFDKSDGIQGNEFSEDAYYLDKAAGEVFFGGNNGLNSFFPDQINDNKFPSQVVFTGLRVHNNMILPHQKVNGRVLLKGPIHLTKHLELSYNEKEFELEFSALHFSNPAQNRYAYQLEGFDDNWTYSNSGRRSAIFSALPAGKYILKVRSANGDGVWNDNPIEMTITILPPWWASAVAYVVYSLLFLCICYLIIRAILYRKNLQYKIELEQVRADSVEQIAHIRSNFFTEISHELRTPVSLIIDPLRKLIRDSDESNKAHGTYQLMYRSARKLYDLVNQLLDFRKIQSAQYTFRPCKHDVVQFITYIVSLFEFEAKKRNTTIRIAVDLKIQTAVFDTGALEKILVNLLSNAFKYADENKEIVLKISDNSEVINSWLQHTDRKSAHGTDCWMIQVVDQGVGIATDLKDRVFDMFFRIDPGVSQIAGSGIGLALTKELVGWHKGSIFLDSTLGEGSTFTILLPVDLAAIGEGRGYEPIGEHQELAIYHDNREKDRDEYEGAVDELPLILVVEDNEDIRNYVKEVLLIDYQVITADNGKHGVEIAWEKIPDLIISDIMMPQVSGIELCKVLKNDERTSHIPIVLLTARLSEESYKEGYETGADDYIGKPFNSELLKVRVKNLIASRRKLRAMFENGTEMELKKISINPVDEKFIKKAVEIVRSHISDIGFTPDLFASEMAISRAQLFRKIKAMTNQTVQEFVMTIRLDQAVALLSTSEKTIGEIASDCGFSETSNFTRSFTKKYGLPPSKYSKSNF